MASQNQKRQPEWDAVNIDASLPIYTIAVAARLCNITVHTIRMYEQKGMVLPYRSRANQRLYSQTDIERIRHIRMHITEEGLNIAGIKARLAMIPCWSIKPCGLDDYRICEAYASKLEPCWQVEKRGTSCDREDCRICPVYQMGCQCNEIKAVYDRYLPDSVLKGHSSEIAKDDAGELGSK